MVGCSDDENVAVMHAFVDQMDFNNTRFVDALRTFLQSFRLPGEAQKIDRFMLKFADRYTHGHPAAFANADTAYVLAYSVIMLNTDLYNPQNKNRMSKADFIKNNRGINDGQDLPEELLVGIYDEIATNEIRMKDEIVTLTASTSGFAASLANVGRDLQREQYDLESEGMASKTEALFRSMLRSSRRSNTPQQAAVGPSRTEFFEAVHFEHVKPMFAVAWMPILAGISGPLQSTEAEDEANITLCLEGFKQAIKIVCLFDLELERNAFVTTLSNFTFLVSGNFHEMKLKNVEVIKCLLDVATINGNYLKTSWRDILICVSQLERFHLLISPGGDGDQLATRRHSKPNTTSKKSSLGKPSEEVAQEAKSTHITMAADRIFSASNTLSGVSFAFRTGFG
jgi:brefeldin A-inhibited guanine nucleotide-exchange protein